MKPEVLSRRQRNRTVNRRLKWCANSEIDDKMLGDLECSKVYRFMVFFQLRNSMHGSFSQLAYESTEIVNDDDNISHNNKQ